MFWMNNGIMMRVLVCTRMNWKWIPLFSGTTIALFCNLALLVNTFFPGTFIRAFALKG